MSVLTEVKERFNEKLDKAYRGADRDLNQRLVGEEVKLIYPYEEGRTSGARVESVTGVVEQVDVGEIPSDNVKFTTCITFEDGRTFTDAENIKILP